jgi:hypothetical protein
VLVHAYNPSCLGGKGRPIVQGCPVQNLKNKIKGLGGVAQVTKHLLEQGPEFKSQYCKINKLVCIEINLQGQMISRSFSFSVLNFYFSEFPIKNIFKCYIQKINAIVYSEAIWEGQCFCCRAAGRVLSYVIP